MAKRRILLYVLCILLFGVTAFAHQENKLLTNTDVVKMLKAGLSESTIILTIQQKTSTFDTSPDALIQLKSEGATPKMLETILQVSSNKAATEEKPPSPTLPSTTAEKPISK